MAPARSVIVVAILAPLPDRAGRTPDTVRPSDISALGPASDPVPPALDALLGISAPMPPPGSMVRTMLRGRWRGIYHVGELSRTL